eukprot:gene47157-38245_t
MAPAPPPCAAAVAAASAERDVLCRQLSAATGAAGELRRVLSEHGASRWGSAEPCPLHAAAAAVEQAEAEARRQPKPRRCAARGRTRDAAARGASTHDAARCTAGMQHVHGAARGRPPRAARAPLVPSRYA